MKRRKETTPMWAICLDFESKLMELGADELNHRIRLCMAFLRSHESHSMILGANGELVYFWFFLDKAVRDGVLEEALGNDTMKDAFNVYGIDEPAMMSDELIQRAYGKEIGFKNDA